MRTIRFRIAMLPRAGFLALLLVLLQGAQCPQVPELKDTALTIASDQFIELEFEARGSINTHSKSDTIRIAELREDIEDAGIAADMIDSVWIARVLYGVTAYNEPPPYDREIAEGRVEVSYEGAPSSAVLFDSVFVRVYPLLGVLTPAPVRAGGVEYLNDLLDAVLNALRSDSDTSFIVSAYSSGISNPQGDDTNFDWRVRVHYQIMGRDSIKVPDL
jgi:hypothetical protein